MGGCRLIEYRLNGDYNPLHATPEPGQKMGFGGPIMHGLSSWNFTAHALLKAMGGSDPKNIKEFSCRFASPVKPGDKLIIEIWKTGDITEGWEEIRFVTKVEGGKVCLSNGRALMKLVGGGKGVSEKSGSEGSGKMLDQGMASIKTNDGSKTGGAANSPGVSAREESKAQKNKSKL